MARFTSPSKTCQAWLAIHYLLTDEALLEETTGHLNSILLPVVSVEVRAASSHFLEIGRESGLSENNLQNHSLLERRTGEDSLIVDSNQLRMIFVNGSAVVYSTNKGKEIVVEKVGNGRGKRGGRDAEVCAENEEGQPKTWSFGKLVEFNNFLGLPTKDLRTRS